MNFDKKRETFFLERTLQERKKHTIRGGFRWSFGDEAQIATGVRTSKYKEHFKINVSGVIPVIILFGEKREGKKIVPDKDKILIYWNGFDVSDTLRSIARNDGFDNQHDFVEWFWHETRKGKGLVVGQCIILHEIQPVTSYNVYQIYHGRFISQFTKIAQRLYNGSKLESKQLKLIKWQSEWRQKILENRRQNLSNEQEV